MTASPARPTALYLRVSDPNSANQADQHGLQVQEDACLAYARAAGLSVQATYTDRISGTVEQRVGFGQLLAEAGRYTDVVVYAMDRLARHPRAGYALIETAHLAGLTIHTAIEGMIELESDSGAMNTGIRLIFADAERRRIVQRMMGGKLAKIRSGKPLHTLRAYGWKQNQVEPTEAAWVQWMYQSALSMGVYSIVDELARLNVPSPRGDARWDPSRVIEILRDSAYRGEWVFGRVRRARATQLKAPISAPCPRIVSDELWYGVQRALDGRRTGQGRRSGRSGVFSLQGRINCAECGRAMVGHQSSNRPGVYYTCGDKRHPAQKRRGCTHGRYYGAPELHAQVRAELTAMLDADLTPHLPAPEAQVRDNTAALAEIDVRMRRVKIAYEEGVDTLAEYREKKERLEAARQSILNAPLLLAPRIDPEQARAALRAALELEDLHDVATQLGLSVKVSAGGTFTLSLDPVI